MKSVFIASLLFFISFSNLVSAAPKNLGKAHQILTEFTNQIDPIGPLKDWEVGASAEFPASTFNYRLRIASGNLYDLADKVELFITPIHPVYGPSDEKGYLFEVFISGRGNGKAFSKNYQAYRIFELALRRAPQIETLKYFDVHDSLGTYGGWLQISDTKELKTLMNHILDVIQEVNIHGHHQIIGPF